MTAIYVLLSIILLITLLLSTKIRFKIDSRNDDLKIGLFVSAFKIFSYPKNEKRRVRLSDYSPKKLKKRKERAERLKAKKEKKKEKKTLSEYHEKKKPLSFYLGFLKSNLLKILKYFRIDLKRVNIVVSTDDAAKTALLYGTISQSTAYIIEILDKITNLKKTKKTEISVLADFTSGKTTVDVKAVLSLRVFHIIKVLFSLLTEMIKNLKEEERQKAPPRFNKTERNKTNNI